MRLWKKTYGRTKFRTLKYQLAKDEPKEASHTLKCFNEYFWGIVKKRQEPKLVALTETWLTKSGTEPKQQWKTGRTTLEESYGIATCSPFYQYQGTLTDKQDPWVTIYTNL